MVFRKYGKRNGDRADSHPAIGESQPLVSKYWEMFWSFFKIGCFTFGGGYAMLPLIQREIIERKKWIGSDEFLELLALAQTSPGPVALNTSVFVGYKRAKLGGALASILGTVLPSFIIILIIAVFFTDFTSYPLVESAFRGMRPAVVALIAAPVYGMMKGMGWKSVVLALAVAVVVGFMGLSPVWFLLAGAVGGIVYGMYGSGDRGKNDRP